MLNAEPKQFSVRDDGRIYFQPDPTNPLPGEPVAALKRGASILYPDVAFLEDGLPEEQDKEAVSASINSWLKGHIQSVLEPLAVLENKEGIEGAPREIADKVYEALGILPRNDLEDLIARLEPEGRQALRACRIRLGPVLVFIPALNKPAAVRLRALLWSLWHDAPLPAPVPHDGIVSISVDPAQADPRFYRAIGYPLYGTRAVRVDMLDRLITAVYDSADKGVFKARHEMAEWLGSPIADLYAVLEAMGHHKVYDPADDVQEEPKADEVRSEEPAPEAIAEETEKPAEEPKAMPELATFRLKKGRASDQAKPFQHRKFENKPGKKPERKKPKKGDKPKRSEKVMQAAAPKTDPEDSPFAILARLKTGSDE